MMPISNFRDSVFPLVVLLLLTGCGSDLDPAQQETEGAPVSTTEPSGEFNVCETRSPSEIATEILPILFPGTGADADRLRACALIHHADVVHKAIEDQCNETAQTGWVAGESNGKIFQAVISTVIGLDENGKCNQ